MLICLRWEKNNISLEAGDSVLFQQVDKLHVRSHFIVTLPSEFMWVVPPTLTRQNVAINKIASIN